jgi:16S rRNA (cytosine967-C5)-methyltransferase
MKNVAPARAAAFEILLAMEREGGRSDALLHRPAINKLSEADRNLATNLVIGTLRWQIALDRRIAALLANPKAKMDAAVRVALRLGAFQLLHLDRIPAYAAIGESVELAKGAGNRFAAGMVNAVLRKIAAQPKLKDTVVVTNPGELARATAHPVWMVERWARNFGFDSAKAICEYNQQPAPVFVRLMNSIAGQDLLNEGIKLTPANFLAHVYSVVGGDITSTKAFRLGKVRVQDEGSQLIAELAGEGSKILDACAAPGGKTAILAERNPEAEITACDISKRRLQEMERIFRNDPNMACVKYVVADAADVDLKPEFDLVLCDAPCSGTGTLARNPEVRHRLSEEELARQHERQVRILSSLMRCVKPKGRLLYSTCSLEPEENETVVQECLKSNSDFKLVSLEREVHKLAQSGLLQPGAEEQLTKTALLNGCLRTIPGLHNCDGFFAALLTRA